MADSEILERSSKTIPIPKPVTTETIKVSDHETCIAAGQINSLGVQLAELALRLAKMELKLAELDNNSGVGPQQSQTAAKLSLQQLRSVGSQVEIITEGLRSTPGYNIGRTFSCGSCHSMGSVAIKVKCTTCDHENWWGWWLQKK